MLPENVSFTLNQLNKNGFEAYAVGGCVRDRLLNIEPDDWDITTSALPEETQKIFADFKLNLKGLKHGTVGIIRNGTMIEVTTFRIDGRYTDSRRPDSVTFTPSLKEDLARRDFTVNAMAMDINENIIVPIKYKSFEQLSSNLFKTKLNGYFGLVDSEGNILLKPEFDKIKPLYDNYVTKKAGKFGLVDFRGNTILTPDFDEIKKLGEYILVKKDKKYGVFDAQGVQLSEINHKKIKLERNELVYL